MDTDIIEKLHIMQGDILIIKSDDLDRAKAQFMACRWPEAGYRVPCIFLTLDEDIYRVNKEVLEKALKQLP